jgi:hypothetical protein
LGKLTPSSSLAFGEIMRVWYKHDHPHTVSI